MGWSICMKNSMKIHKIAGVLCALQSVTNLGSKCNQTQSGSLQLTCMASFSLTLLTTQNDTGKKRSFTVIDATNSQF